MVLITGAAGVVGRVLVEKLYHQGKKIRALVLPDDPCLHYIQPYVSDIVYADIRDHSRMHEICKNVRTVYHLAAVIIAKDPHDFTTINVQGTRNIINSAQKDGVSHFIYVSSASVTYPKPTPYSLSKRKCESMVVESSVPFTIVRPTLVYDKYEGGQEFDMFLSYLKRFPVVPFIGSGHALKRPVYVEDIIDGLVKLEGAQQSLGKIYNFSGKESIEIIEFARLCLKLSGIPGKMIIPLPVWFYHILAFLMKGIMNNPPLNWQVIAGITQDANLDPAQAVKEIGYTPCAVSGKLQYCFPRKA